MGPVLAVVLGTVAALASASLTVRVMDECEIGVNASANLFGMLLVLPVLAVADIAAFAVVSWLVFRVVARVTPAALAGWIAVLAGLLPLALIAWGLVAWSVPADYPMLAACPGDLSWWPSWLPV